MLVQDYTARSSLLEAILLFGIYLTTLLTSITVYRVYFHRLSRAGFPGPRSARITKLWHAWACKDSRSFLVLDSLARQYGDFVRTGPSELTITHPDVYQAIDGPGSVCGKADWYDITHPNISLVTARNSKVHDHRRRIWDQGFSTKAVDGYKQRTLKYVSMLEEHIASDVSAGKSVDVTTLFGWFGFDVMGDFVFGDAFEMSEEWHSVTLTLREALNLLGPLSPVPWLVHFGFNMAGFLPSIKNWFAMIAWCRRQMENRAKLIKEDNNDSEPDVSYWLIEDARKNRFMETDWRWLTGDAVLAIVAGSETVTSTLTCLFYRLASNPTVTAKLHTEVAAIDDWRDDKVLQKLPYLNGVVNETLRLHPALLTGGLRKTPKEGAMVCGRFVPGDVTIVAPRYTIFRREDCFENAEMFMPERWAEDGRGMVRGKNAFKPFGTGMLLKSPPPPPLLPFPPPPSFQLGLAIHPNPPPRFLPEPPLPHH
ncbi:MAG: hypothetical protein L6R40_003068 [Gallowayella cf. fulva]|nr:MAG: hypothetical protein L6R40_003068 [Xanthomendoza cf. fulva]